MELKRAFLDGKVSIDVMPISTFRHIGILNEDMVKPPITIYGFRGDKKKSVSYVLCGLDTGEILFMVMFHVIDIETIIWF